MIVPEAERAGLPDEATFHLSIGAATADLDVVEIGRAAGRELAPGLRLSLYVDSAWPLVERFPLTG